MPIFNRDSGDAQQEFFKPALQRSYTERLRHIGRELDQANMRSIAIVEISGSFIVRAVERRTNSMVVSEVVAEDFANAERHRTAMVNSASYEAMLRVLGEDLDEFMAANIAIVERGSSFEMVGWAHGTAAGTSTYVAVDVTYPFADLQIWAAKHP